MTTNEHYDIVICGGGLAGLTMARQILLRRPGTSVLVIDNASVPSPAAGHKVGESIPEGAAHFLRHSLDLDDYLSATHIPKFGLRFFYGGGSTPLENRLEYGGTQWPPIATYQLDRGLLENDLRAMVVGAGATVLTGTHVLDVDLSENGGLHSVRTRRGDDALTVTARWVVDASGRARLIAKKRGLTRRIDHRVSVCWWRTDHTLRVDDFVDPANDAWHDRVGPPRWHSTNQLAGDGYWVWLIPLAGGRTSVGIVADEGKHPLRDRRSFEQAVAWCRQREPQLADALENTAPLDFHTLKNFAYTTTQAFSHHRWACIGDAAVLADPLYSFGQELIAHAELMTMRLIELDEAGALTEESVQAYDTVFRDLFGVVHDQFTGTYGVFGSPFMASQKLAWDSSMYFAIFQQAMLQNLYDHPDAPSILGETLRRLKPLNLGMQALFTDSRQLDGRMDIHKGMRTWSPRVGALADASVHKHPQDMLRPLFTERFAALQDIATVIFGEVVRHSPSIPAEAAAKVLDAGTGIDPAAISLHPERWDKAGLFRPDRSAVDFSLPAQFDVEKILEANRAAFVTVSHRFRRAALAHPDRTAIVETDGRGQNIPGGEVTYDQLLSRVAHTEELVSPEPGRVIGVSGNATEAVVSLLGVVGTGRAAVPLDTDWDEHRRSSVAERCGFTTVLDRGHIETLPGVAVPPSHSTPPGGACSLDGMKKPAVRDCRFTDWGLRVTHLDEGSLFRMHGWLSRLLAKVAGPEPRAEHLTCLWVGPVRPELALLLTLGHRIVTVPSGATEAGILLGLIEDRKIDVLLARPEDMRPLSEAGWTPHPVQAVAVGEALPHDLSRTLRRQAAGVYDFAYVTFGH